MAIEQVARGLIGIYDLPQAEKKEAGSAQSGFIDYFKNAISDVDKLQKEAENSVERMILGEEPYLHNTVIAYEKARLAFQLTVEVRNRLLEAYQEVMRMQF